MKKQHFYIGVFIAILIAILCVQQCSLSNLKTDLAMKDNNMRALQDTIEETKNDLGQVQFEKSVLISSEAGLKELNSEIAAEVKAQSGKVAYLAKIVSGIQTQHDGPTNIDTGLIGKSGNPCDSIANYTLPWNSDKTFDANNSRKLNGVTSFTMNKGAITNATNEVKQDEMNFDIVTGLEKKDDHYEIFIRSNYPGFKPSKIDGAFIPQKDLFPPQKKQKWSIGPTFNGGLGAAFTPTGVQPALYVGVGLGINYGFIKF
jgi:hypothetical protein